MDNQLLNHFSSLPDPRVERTKRYPLNEIILLIISAALSGFEGWKQIKDFGEIKLEWLRKFLPYKQGIPVDDTIARVMYKLDTKAFQSCFISWMQSVVEATDGDVIAIDGKTLRRSHDKASGKSAIHMVSAWSCANSVVLGQEKTSEKSNEITAIPELLNVLELKGCIVSIDAMGCQTAIAEQIVQHKADYILALKGNQGHLHEEVKDFFKIAQADDFSGVTMKLHEEYDKGHGRIEHRQCWVLEANQNYFPSMVKWKNLNQIVIIKSQRQIKEKTTEDTRFYITSLMEEPEKLLHSVRQHWQVENALHWTLDVTFREDESRIRKEAAPENYAMFRHITLNLLKSDTTRKASIKRKRLMASIDDDFRETLIRQGI
jgi:predicted transposase YbfD/YdcC